MNEQVEKLLLKAINGDILTERQWEELVTECRDWAIEEQEWDLGRWHTLVTVIFQYKDKFYGITFERGNTECQENEYYNSEIFEVCKVTKTIETWKPVKED